MPAICSADCGVGILKGDLYMIDPGFLETLSAISGEAESRGDEGRIHPFAAGVGDQLLKILPHQRLAT